MTPAQERAQVLAREIKETMRAIKLAEARIRELSQELTQTLERARVEAEEARLIVEYPSGRYECSACGHSTLFTEPTRELPACDNCGQRKWAGHEPKVTRIAPPPPKRFPAGMYECAACGARTAVGVDTDDMPPCELCDRTEFKSVRI